MAHDDSLPGRMCARIAKRRGRSPPILLATAVRSRHNARDQTTVTRGVPGTAQRDNVARVMRVGPSMLRSGRTVRQRMRQSDLWALSGTASA